MASLLSFTDIYSISRPLPAIKRRRTSGDRPPPSSRGLACNRQRVKEEQEKRVIRVWDPIISTRESILGPWISPLYLSESLMLQQQKLKEKEEGGDDKQHRGKEEYYVNMGYAIRTLREELPHIFNKPPSFHFYRDDIVFKDPLNTFIGIDNYKWIFWVLRFIGRLFFKALWIDIVSVYQPVENVVMIRWISHGIPRVPWKSHGRFDGISEYRLDGTGKIYEHRVDNIVPNPPNKFKVLSVNDLIQTLGCPSTPNPTYFETSLFSVVKSVPFLLAVTCASYYIAFCLLFSLQCVAEG